MNRAFPVYFLPRDIDTLRKFCRDTTNPDALLHLLTHPDEPFKRGDVGCIRLNAIPGRRWDARSVTFGKQLLSAARYAYSVCEEHKKFRDPRLQLSELLDVVHTCGDYRNDDGIRQICLNPTHFRLASKHTGRVIEPSGCIARPADLRPRLVALRKGA